MERSTMIYLVIAILIFPLCNGGCNGKGNCNKNDIFPTAPIGTHAPPVTDNEAVTIGVAIGFVVLIAALIIIGIIYWCHKKRLNPTYKSTANLDKQLSKCGNQCSVDQNGGQNIGGGHPSLRVTLSHQHAGSSATNITPGAYCTVVGLGAGDYNSPMHTSEGMNEYDVLVTDRMRQQPPISTPHDEYDHLAVFGQPTNTPDRSGSYNNDANNSQGIIVNDEYDHMPVSGQPTRSTPGDGYDLITPQSHQHGRWRFGVKDETHVNDSDEGNNGNNPGVSDEVFCNNGERVSVDEVEVGYDTEMPMTLDSKEDAKLSMPESHRAAHEKVATDIISVTDENAVCGNTSEGHRRPIKISVAENELYEPLVEPNVSGKEWDSSNEVEVCSNEQISPVNDTHEEMECETIQGNNSLQKGKIRKKVIVIENELYEELKSEKN